MLEPFSSQERLCHWLELTPVPYLKVKLGNPEGIEADRQMLHTLLTTVPPGCKIYGDVNGGR